MFSGGIEISDNFMFSGGIETENFMFSGGIEREHRYEMG